MTNERITENIVRNLLRTKNFYDNDDIVIEEQASQDERINNLLKNASKTGQGKNSTTSYQMRQARLAIHGALHQVTTLQQEFRIKDNTLPPQI